MTEITFRLDDPPEELDALAFMLDHLPSVIRLREARQVMSLPQTATPTPPPSGALVGALFPTDAAIAATTAGQVEWAWPEQAADEPTGEIDENQPDLFDGDMPAPPGGWAPHESGAVIPTEDAAPLDIESRDSTGALWDPELHASSKALTKDGKWRARRNSGEAPPPPPAVAPPPPPPPPSAPAITFAQMMTKLTPGFGDGSLTMLDVNQALGRLGVTNLPALNQSPDLIPDLLRELGL